MFYCFKSKLFSSYNLCYFIYRFLECVKKKNGCMAQGEMFNNETQEWVFVLHGDSHNHSPCKDH